MEREVLQGTAWSGADAEELREALEKAFDYRGDVTLGLKDGSRLEGYVFDRRGGRRLEDSLVRILRKDGQGRISIAYSEIGSIEFSGRDTAAGKSWEAWVKRYQERKAAGEKNIELKPDELD